jgi:hypothetical protein
MQIPKVDYYVFFSAGSLIYAPAGYVKTYIILPSTIYGFASGPLVDKGIQNTRSQQIPTLVDVSLQRGQGGMIGKGKNWWGNVHIDDGNKALSTCRRY